MSDPELTAMQAAYEHLKGLDRRQWTRALEYISRRMAEDDRGSHVTVETLAPTWFTTPEFGDERFDTPDEAVAEAEDRDSIIEVTGCAVVSQRFVAMIPLGDEYGIHDYDLKWFDTRDAAEKYLAEMMAPEATDASPA